MTDSIPTAELCQRYEQLYPGAVTDVLDDRGLQDQTLDPEIGPIEPSMTTAGIAYPCVGRPDRSLDEETNIRNILSMLGDVPEHGVVVYETNSTDSAQIGELSVECLLANDVRGAVLDGGARDLRYILENDFPLFSRFETPADAVPRWKLLEWETDVVVGGVDVSPGDVVVGDIDGVVVVPEAISEPVLREAESLAGTEDSVREAVRDGTHPLEAYDNHGVF